MQYLMLALCKPFICIVYSVEIDFFSIFYYIYVYNALKKPSTNHLPQSLKSVRCLSLTFPP